MAALLPKRMVDKIIARRVGLMRPAWDVYAEMPARHHREVEVVASAAYAGDQGDPAAEL